MARNLCLNYAVTAAGAISYLGCAEQVTDAEGKYHGNWIDDQCDPPAEAVEAGLEVARAGYVQGYWGCVGIDMAVLDDGKVILFDLNFRLNGSTTPLLLAESVRKNSDKSVIRSSTFKGRSTYRDMLNGAYKAMTRGIFLPLNSYDPEVCANSLSGPRIGGLILGRTREEVNECERELAALGLES